MAEQIKDTNVLKTPPVVFDPTFFMPPGLIDVTTKDIGGDFETGAGVDDSEAISVEVNAEDVEATSGDIVSTLSPPQWIEVSRQEIRIGPDGRSVVDVTLICDTVLGAIDYDVRIARSLA